MFNSTYHVKYFFIVCLVLAVSVCSAFSSETSSLNKTWWVDSICEKRANLPDLFQKRPVMPEGDVKAYFDYYGLNFLCKEHYFGKFESQGYILTGQIFVPESPKAFIVILHGYFDHCAVMKDLISFLIMHQYAVGIYDMPGHGFSSGEKVSINNFHVYSAILKDFQTLCEKRFQSKFHLIAHSTGCSAGIDYILNNKGKVKFNKIILLAPLIRSWAWYFSKTSTYVLSPFLNRLPRLFVKNSSDKKFLEFTKKNDPLQYRFASLKWAKALFAWNKDLKKPGMSDHKIHVIQGDKDRIVAWRYNLKMINKKFPMSQIIIIKGAKHHLVNEAIKFKTQVFNLILDDLKTADSNGR